MERQGRRRPIWTPLSFVIASITILALPLVTACQPEGAAGPEGEDSVETPSEQRDDEERGGAAPYTVDSPEVVCGYLDDKGLESSPFEALDGGDYSCASETESLGLLLDAPDVGDTVSYEVDGSATRVRRLRLLLRVNDPENEEASHEQFLDIAGDLVQDALGRPLPEPARDAVYTGGTGNWTLADSAVSVTTNRDADGSGYRTELAVGDPSVLTVSAGDGGEETS